jgi:hypothetical protein
MFTLSRTIGLPAELSVVSEGHNMATFEIKGLYPGYGHTMGNAPEFFNLNQNKKPITIYRPLIKAHAMVAVSYVGMTREYWRKCFPSVYSYKDMLDLILNVWKPTFIKYSWFTDQLVLYQTLIKNPEIAQLCNICDDSHFKRLDKHELKDVDPKLYSDCHLPKLDETNKQILNNIIEKL